MEELSEYNNAYTYVWEGSIIPQNLQWRAGINDPTASQPNNPGQNIAQAFLQQWGRTPPKVEMPPIQKSKQDQYWDAVLNNGVVWKTPDYDTRSETQAELQAQQKPIMIFD